MRILVLLISLFTICSYAIGDLLGKEFIGKAIKGAQQAKSLGMPTLNMPCNPNTITTENQGTYACWVSFFEFGQYKGKENVKLFYCPYYRLPGVIYAQANRIGAEGAAQYQNDHNQPQLIEIHILNRDLKENPLGSIHVQFGHHLSKCKEICNETELKAKIACDKALVESYHQGKLIIKL